MKSTWKITGALILLTALLAAATACNPFATKPPVVTRQYFPVTRGDLAVSVSGDGHIALLTTRKLSFSTGGKITEVNVKEADRVKEGQVLARLDTADMELAIAQAEFSLASAQYDLANRGALELAMVRAEAALELAKFNLDRMKDISDAKDDIREAENEVQIAKANVKWAIAWEDNFGINYWRTQVLIAEMTLGEKQKELADLLKDEDYATLVVDDIEVKKLQVKLAETELAQAKKTLMDTEVPQKRVQLASKSLEHAREQLKKVVLTAPFDGVINKVNVKAGETVSSATFATTVAFELIDPVQMELSADVDEIDIPGVKVGQKVAIKVDALPEAGISGTVSSIDMLPKEVSGVVLYPVKVTFNAPPGVEIRPGMSATASIITTERNNVLQLPNRAIGQDSQGKPVVKVKVGEALEERQIVTGIGDGVRTEIVSGLEEEDVVVVERQSKPAESGGLFGG